MDNFLSTAPSKKKKQRILDLKKAMMAYTANNSHEDNFDNDEKMEELLDLLTEDMPEMGLMGLLLKLFVEAISNGLDDIKKEVLTNDENHLQTHYKVLVEGLDQDILRTLIPKLQAALISFPISDNNHITKKCKGMPDIWLQMLLEKFLLESKGKHKQADFTGLLITLLHDHKLAHALEKRFVQMIYSIYGCLLTHDFKSILPCYLQEAQSSWYSYHAACRLNTNMNALSMHCAATFDSTRDRLAIKCAKESPSNNNTKEMHMGIYHKMQCKPEQISVEEGMPTHIASAHNQAIAMQTQVNHKP